MGVCILPRITLNREIFYSLIMLNFPQNLPVFLVVVFLLSSFGIPKEANPKNGYYIVIAAYAATKEDFAKRFVDRVNADGHSSQYDFFQKKNMYFVYLEYFSERSPSIQHMRDVRKNTPFDDSWVYVFKDGSENDEISDTTPTPLVVSSEPENTTEEKSDENDVTSANEEQDENEIQVVNDVTAGIEEVKEVPVGKYKVYFHLTNGQNRDELDGKVDVIDPNTGNVAEILDANKLHYINPPNRNDNRIQFETEIFGYRKIIHTIDFDDPYGEGTDFIVEPRGDTTVVFFDLIRFRKGDTFTMYNVYFFSSTAVMRPESQNELMDLKTMLTQNPGYRITLHGHVNGGGNINGVRYHPENDTSFFTTGDAQLMDMSAKELSEMRAAAVKNYLIHSGIDASRMETKGWGGKKGIYKTSDPRANKNVRVEVEIMK